MRTGIQGLCVGLAGFVGLAASALSAEPSDPVQWFRQAGNNCPQIDEIDAHLRQTNPNLMNGDIVGKTIDAFSTIYHSQECTPKDTTAKYTGEPIYKAIVADYKVRHPDSVAMVVEPRKQDIPEGEKHPMIGAASRDVLIPPPPKPVVVPPPASAQLVAGDPALIGKWAGKETCGSTPRTVTLNIVQGDGGSMNGTGTSAFGFGSRPFDQVRISGKSVQMISQSTVGDAVFDGALISDTRIEGHYKRPGVDLFKSNCTWFVSKK